MELERRLDELESRMAILELIARYCHGADTRDARLFRRLWHPDAVWVVGDSASHRFTGHDQILEGLARQWSAFEAMHHSTSNSVVEFDSVDVARGRHDVTSVAVLGGGQHVLTLGAYVDRYTRRAGQWRIAERRATVTTRIAWFIR